MLSHDNEFSYSALSTQHSALCILPTFFIREPSNVRFRYALCEQQKIKLAKGGKEMFSTLFSIGAIILDIFAISDVMRSSRDIMSKIVLLVLILLIPYVGAGLYLFALRDKGYS